MRYKKVILGIIIIPLVILAFLAFQPTYYNETEIRPNASFVLSLTPFPALDEYGQGIIAIDAEENSTGSWQNIEPFGGIPDPFNLTYGNFIRLKVETILNSVLVGASSLADGKNYFKHSISVTNSTGVLFSQQNFTYFNSGAIGIDYYYDYIIILNYLFPMGQVYTATITYEVFY